MKKHCFIFFLIMLAMVLLSFNQETRAAEMQILFGYSDAKAFPYQIRHDADPPGIAIEILDQVCNDLGIQVVFVRLPNKRVQISLQHGLIDGAFMYSFKKNRQKNGMYPLNGEQVDEKKRLATLSYHLYTLKGAPLKWDGKCFTGVDFSDKNLNIAANLGYSIATDLKKMGVNVDAGSKTTDQNFKKLLAGRVVGYAQQDLVADNYLKTKGIMIVEKNPVPLVTKPYFLMFSHQFMQQHPKTAVKIWHRIAEIRDTVIKEVSHRYSD